MMLAVLLLLFALLAGVLVGKLVAMAGGGSGVVTAVSCCGLCRGAMSVGC